MAKDRMTLLELLRKSVNEGNVDFLRRGGDLLAYAIMEPEARARLASPNGIGHCQVDTG